MTDAQPHLSVVVPSYNNADRLPASLRDLKAFCHALPFTWELIVVDDCSPDPESERLLREFAATEPGVTLIRQERNRGKGAAVARGMLTARGKFRVFTDVDLAYPPSEILAILGALEAGADMAVACRVDPRSTYIMNVGFFHYLYTRHIMSRIFNRMVRLVLLRDVLDTQAGLKGLTAAAAEKVFTRLTIPRFGFDVEAIFIAQHHRLRVDQVPITFRYDSEPTTMNFGRDAARMLRDLWHVRAGGWSGRYD
ncbi:MAG: glycosyltransferase [Gemmatimonadetes bacterium]|nr:glycosyltransferase [Gemmatimonadota bacterium]